MMDGADRIAVRGKAQLIKANRKACRMLAREDEKHLAYILLQFRQEEERMIDSMCRQFYFLVSSEWVGDVPGKFIKGL
jgi:hypothetical protein